MRLRKLTVTLLFVLLGVLCFNSDAYAQRKSRRTLLRENQEMRRMIDSLQALLSDEIPLSDTLTLDDTINPGNLNILDTEMYVNATPGQNSDSLLSLWYLQKQLTVDSGNSVDLDNANFTSSTPDEVYIANIKKMNSYVPIPYNSIVKNHIIFYTQKIPNKSAAILGLSSYYMPIFEEIFDSYGLPKELTVMAIIESALNPFAVSRTRAKGIWQFMYTTAKQYDLEINSYVDERLDPVASAHAAARYLRDSYAIFGDWALAIASYNCGAGNVNKAIRRAGGSKNFWDVYNYLPRETRGYIPAFVGALYLTHYYKNYNIVPDRVTMPAHVDTFRIHHNLHFEQIADNLGITVNELRELNPQYTQDIIPASDKGYVLKLPYNYTVPFVEKEKEIYAYKDSIYFNPIVYAKYKSGSDTNAGNAESRIYHKVKSGQTLGSIARRYGVSVAQLKRWNGLKGNTIRIGQRLVIYKRGGTASYSADSGSSSKSSASGSASSASSSGKYTTYTIRKGDTLYGIAKKHGMSLNDLLKINGLTTKSKIVAGKKIKVKG